MSAGADSGRGVAHARWALLSGNFAIACGVMAPAGVMNDLVDSLRVSVAWAGQLTTIGAVVLAVGAPTLAAWVAGSDRRRLLTFWLAWYGVGHLVCALAPDYPTLAVVRTITLLGAAVFTPQAGAAIGVMTRPEARSGAITFVFLGWAVASVLGMPINAYVAETVGWRWAFVLVGAMAAMAALWVWHAIPDGVRPAALSAAHWREVLTNPVLMAIVSVTAMAGAAQFTLFSYMAPYYRQTLGASPAQIALLFLIFGAVGLAGSVAVTRTIDRVGPGRMVALLSACMIATFALWPWATSVSTMALVLIPWALGCFSAQSSQHARLSVLVPAFAPASMALNSSAIYVGQAVGAATGGALLTVSGYSMLHRAALAWMVLALGLSLWAGRRSMRLLTT